MTASQSAHQSFESRLAALRHDLRTPVGHIIGYAELIEEELTEDQKKAYGYDLVAVMGAGQKMLAIIDLHLNAQKTSAEDIEFAEVQFSLRMQLNHVGGYTEMLREEAVDRGDDAFVGDLAQISSAVTAPALRCASKAASSSSGWGHDNHNTAAEWPQYLL